jgi:hypothetical protein
LEFACADKKMPRKVTKEVCDTATFLLAASLLLTAALAPAHSQDVPEYTLKATFLFNFPEFTNWPAAATNAPFVVCVVGADPFGKVLDDAADAERILQRAVRVRRIPLLTRTAACDVAYLGGSAAQSHAEAIASVAGTPVLTISDEAAPGNARGLIHFVVTGGRVRFSVDPDGARANGLSFSSRLLGLAVK